MSQKYTLAEIQLFAQKKGGQCISPEYVSLRKRLKWKCGKGHEWIASAGPILYSSVWCPTCAGRPKLSIEDMIAIAEKNGGKCLSKKYVNLLTKLLWECAQGHRWKSTGSTVKHLKTWCPKCAGVAKYSIKDMQCVAIERGGRCLSRKYTNVNTQLLWECAEGHRWKTRPVNILHSDTWCHTCARYGKLTIEEMQRIAQERGGECLSKIYINCGTKLLWKCAKGHTWRGTPNDIKSNKSWCPHCAQNAQLTIGRLKKAARKRGGSCLDEEYVVGQQLTWKCNNGHTWKAMANSILRGSWCRRCYGTYLYSESRCRYILEKLLKTRFPLNETVLDGLQLDGYSAKLNIGFEYNGQQHYDPKFYFHTSVQSFNMMQTRDRKKVELCRTKKIKFIVIPYYKANTNTELLSFIVGQLKKRHIPILSDTKKVDLSNVPLNKSRLAEINRIAARKGIRCLSKEYINANTKLLFECRHGHTWDAEPSRIKAGSGCPYCSGKYKNSIESVRVFAEERNGKCLSKKYKNILTQMTWECERGHKWKSNFSNLYHGERWCQQCPKEKIFELLCEIAAKKGGRCLSPRYINDDVKMKWECLNKHVWETRSRLIKDGAWCPACNHDRLRLTIPEINDGLRDREIICLSKKYENNAQKLRWQCHKGHTWRASTNMVRNFKSSGCPHCWKIRRIQSLVNKQISRINYSID